MGEINAYIRCAACNGVGTIPNSFLDPEGIPVTDGTKTCPRCNGEGKYLWGKLDVSDLEDKFNDILNKCDDIFEKVSE